MKKFIITLFILLILGGTGFFIGWVQLEVPPGSYGIIISKTHGVDPEPIKSGEFRWVWYKLIPTNVQITVFRFDPVKVSIDFNSSLPSSDVYASFAGLNASAFSWNLKGEISFNINPDKLISMTEQHNITDQETFDVRMQEISQNIKVIIMHTLSSADIDNERLEKILAGNQDEEIENEIKNRYPEILNFSFFITSAKSPDFILYTQVRLLYEEFLTKQREYVAASFGRRAETHIEVQLRLNELENYGILLSKYPILLEYIAMERGIQSSEP